MSKTLVINAHPKVDSEDSISLKIYQYFLNCYRNSKFFNEVDQIDLYQDVVPAIDQTYLYAWEKSEKGLHLSQDEQKVLDRMAEILTQFKQAKRYIIVMPLHNWNIPSKLKDYMDNIIIPQETFKYHEDGSIKGLLTGNRSVLVIQASDGVYTNNDWNTELEFSHKYLKSMFQLLGVEAYQIIRAQGHATFKKEEILLKASEEVRIAVEKWINEESQWR